eukprot:1691108-Alexandrium_andersonii.AAC.1
MKSAPNLPENIAGEYAVLLKIHKQKLEVLRQALEDVSSGAISGQSEVQEHFAGATQTIDEYKKAL